MLAEVRRELDAQINRVCAAGIDISHLDGHQHVHVLPGVARIVAELAAAHGVRAVRYPAERVRGYMLGRVRHAWRVVEQAALGLFCAASPLKRLRRSDDFVGFFFGGRLDEANLATLLAACRRGAPSSSWSSRRRRVARRAAGSTRGRGARRAREPSDSRARRRARHAARFHVERCDGRSEFDKFADEYGPCMRPTFRLSCEAPEYFAEYKVADIAAELARDGAAARKVLDFWRGCRLLGALFRAGTCLAHASRVSTFRARAWNSGRSPRYCRGVRALFDGRRIQFDDGTFDVALRRACSTTYPHGEHVALLAEIRRVLARRRLFVFEHNPLNPLTRHAVNTCAFDENAQLVLAPTMRRRARDAGFASADVRYRIFFPHALRGLRPLEPSLTWLPLGAQYYVAARKAG